MSVSVLRGFVGHSRVGLCVLFGGLSSAVAQTEAPAAEPAAPEAPVAAEEPPPAAAPDAPAPETAAPEATEPAAPELSTAPASASGAALAPAPASAPPAPLVTPGEPAPPAPNAVALGVRDDGASADADAERQQPRQFGAMFDLGVPDGTTLSFVYRPIDLARVHAGLSYNGVSAGLRLGAEYLPLGWGPSLGFALGHYFEGDASGVAGMFGTISDDTRKLLENVGYDYFALRAGMEFGGDRFTFFARGGVSWLRTTLHELDTIIEPDPGSNTTVEVKEDPVLNAFTPTLQLGFIVQI